MRIAEESMTKVRLRISRLTLLMVLATGGVSPVFRADITAKIVGVVCTVMLCVLAAPRVLRVSRHP